MAIQAPIRFASFNASLNRNIEGQLITDLSTQTNTQAQNVAEIIQRVSPDIVLINEFDYDAAGTAAQLFQQNYLSVGQNEVVPIDYAYRYVAPANTGVASGFDFDNNGAVVTTPGAPGYGNDALGFGNFPGQYGMAVYSKYEIDFANIRTFQNFLWQDMPGALLPDDPTTPEPNDWYSQEELAAFRLSSKTHWDIPININGEIIHVLASHPTPPTFDGAEDRNGTRNHDEIRFWADYITPNQGNYIYDDAGNFGGLAPGSRFVIMGDQNADPLDGDSTEDAILQLLDNPLVNTTTTPLSAGGLDAAARQDGANETHLSNPAFDTADFADTAPGNLRVDYVLPSQSLEITDASVFWPKSDDPLFRLVGDFDPSIPGGFPSSDHRLVWADVDVNTLPVVLPTVETPQVIDLENPPDNIPPGDADDPAIYVHPTDPSQSLVIATLKDGGLATYDLNGAVLQSILPGNPGDIRYNNVDLLYGFNLGSQNVDLAIASDRQNDTLAIFQINPTTRQLTDITPDSITDSIFGVDDGEQTAYGLATYTSPLSGKSYVFVSKRETGEVAQLELVTNSSGEISTTRVRTLNLPVPLGGEPEDAQVEGMVADRELGYLYVGQEKVGIWKFLAEPEASSTGELLDAVKPNGSNLEADVEGLTIYYTGDGQGYLLASSQGDNTFAVYNRAGNNEYLGNFAIGDSNGIDQVQESDGADIVSVPLGSFASGLLVVQDGDNDPPVLAEDDGELENVSSNFKFVPWENVANAFPNALAIDTTFNPRLIAGTDQADELVGTNGSDRFNGFQGDDTITGLRSRDRFTGGGDHDTFIINRGDGTDTITDFGGIGAGVRPSSSTIAEVDTINFQGEGLSARNMLLSQEQSNLVISFMNVDDTKVILENFDFSDLENLQTSTGAAVDLGNILFDGQNQVQDSFDVFNPSSQNREVFNPDSVTFLNDLNNNVKGLGNSDDVINAQGGNDTVEGLTGNDLLRGGTGNDRLLGRRGNDYLAGGTGDDFLNGGFDQDTLIGGSGSDRFVLVTNGADTIVDFTNAEDSIGLSSNLQFEQLTIAQGTGTNISDTVISLTDSGLLLATLSGVQSNTITSVDFINI